MAKIKTLNDVLLEELKDLYSAENQLLKALPKMQKCASNASLKEAFASHLEETQTHVERLDKIGSLLKEKLTGKTCKAMQGLIEEGKEVMEEESDNEALIDTMLIGAAQRVEHYEMAGYGTARTIAAQLGLDKVVSLLEETLEEEKAADEKLTEVSESEILMEAMGGEEEEEEEDEDEAPVAKKKGRVNGRSVSMAALVFALMFQPYSASADDVVRQKDVNANEREAAQYAPDNSGRNTRDVNPGRPTADDQSYGTDSQNETLARVRREIVKNDNLSVMAKNIKIILENNQLTLRGPVKNVQERDWIAQAATKAAGNYPLNNQLEVASK